MNKENKLVPQLRFPEFVNEEEWEEKELIELSVNGFSNGVFNDPKKVGAGYRLINVIDMYSESVINERNLSLLNINESEFKKNKVEEGDIFFTRSSLVASGIAKSNIYLGTSDNITFDGHLIRLRPNKKLVIPIFLNYALKTAPVRSQLIAKGKTATMTTIGQTDISSVKLSIPTKPTEQQKIASCLSSLDELIAAESQKLEALKEHKKGLMQNLFPQEGETVPKLRFKEFVNDGDWEEKKLGEICDVRDGTHDSPKYVSEGYPLITSKNLLPNGNIDFENVSYITNKDYTHINKRSKVDIGDVLFGMIGTIGNPVMVKIDGFAIKNVALIKTSDKLNQSFLLHQLKSDYILKQFTRLNAGGILKFIALGMIRNLNIITPNNDNEQQKIADCLSSLDALIQSQGEKIEALKLHKKGLMQGLFPQSAS